MAQGDERDTTQPPGGATTPAGTPDAPGSPWRTLGSREVYRNPWITVTEYAVVRPDGQPGMYGVVDPGDNVSIVAVDAEESVYLIGEFRYTLQRYAWMIPSGKVEHDEDPLAAARRELEEEAGIAARTWTLLGAHPLSSGISTQVSHIFLARDLTLDTPRPEATEQLALKRVPLREAFEACLRDEIRDATSVLGIWRAWRLLHGEG